METKDHCSKSIRSVNSKYYLKLKEQNHLFLQKNRLPSPATEKATIAQESVKYESNKTAVQKLALLIFFCECYGRSGKDYVGACSCVS